MKQVVMLICLLAMAGTANGGRRDNCSETGNRNNRKDSGR